MAGCAVPTITTERLCLRAHRRTDLDACAAMWSDRDVVRFIGGTPFSRAETWGKMLRYAGLWALLGYGYWAIEDRATGAFAGELGFADFQRDVDSRFARLPELGWVLTPSLHGRGYATEAVQAAVLWGDTHLTSALTIAFIAAEHAASQRVAAKAGYTAAARTVLKDAPIVVFSRPRGGEFIR